MTVWAPFSFRDEVDVLEIKLATLYPVVDRFLIAESTVTHSGLEKPLVLERHLQRFAPWWDKVTYVTDGEMPNDVWGREHQQRANLAAHMHVEPDDVVFVSDCDEIPNPAYWDRAIETAMNGFVAVPRLDMHVLALRWRWPETWPGAARFVRGDVFLGAFHGNLETLVRTYDQDVGRLWAGDTSSLYGPAEPPSLGWHFSFMGGVDAVVRKLASNAHTETNVHPWNDPAHIAMCIETGVDIIERPERRQVPAVRDELPPHVLENWDRFERLWTGAS